MSTALAVIGTAFTAIGQIRQANAQASAQRYNAGLKQREVAIAEANADLTRQQTNENERRHRTLARKKLGSLRANLGASGVTIDGSALDVLEESAANAELDALTIRHEGKLKELSQRNQGLTSRADSELLKSSASSTETSGYMSAAGTLLSGGTKAYNMHQNRQALKQT